MTESDSLDEILLKAESGNVEAQYRAGFLLLTGLGVKPDAPHGLAWLRRAAEAGHAQGACILGVQYETGGNLPVNLKEAFKWYRCSANLGYAQAQVNLGRMFLAGKGVAPDRIQGKYWLSKAAGQGNAQAKMDLETILCEDSARALHFLGSTRDAPAKCAQRHGKPAWIAALVATAVTVLVLTGGNILAACLVGVAGLVALGLIWGAGEAVAECLCKRAPSIPQTIVGATIVLGCLFLMGKGCSHTSLEDDDPASRGWHRP